MSGATAKIQSFAPQFKTTAVIDGDFKEVSLSDYKGKYVVLFFYPLDFTFVCPTEIIAFSDRVEEFRRLKCEVLACSTDSHFSHLAWINIPRKQGGLGSMNIPLLSDKNHQISRDYGVLLNSGIALRGLFIIDGNGVIRQITINDLSVGRSVDEILRLVKAFQFTDEHGEGQVLLLDHLGNMTHWNCDGVGTECSLTSIKSSSLKIPLKGQAK